MIFDGSGSYAHENNTIVRYGWDVDGDGVYDFNTNVPFFAYTYNEDFDGLLSLLVTDSAGLSGLATAFVDVSIDGDGVPSQEDNCPLVHNPSQADQDWNGIGDACDEADIRSIIVSSLVPPSIAFGKSSFSGKPGMPIPIKETVASLLDHDVAVTWIVANGISCFIKDPTDLETTVKCAHAGDYDLTVAAKDGMPPPVGQLTRLLVEGDDIFERHDRPGKYLRCKKDERNGKPKNMRMTIQMEGSKSIMYMKSSKTMMRGGKKVMGSGKTKSCEGMAIN
jgi:hypothetical protein